MAGYIGVRCPVCNKKFAGTDDIVVCPSCGAPHHRECYLKNGSCAFADEHINGKVWHNPQKAEEDAVSQTTGANASSNKTCAQCGKESPSESLFCNHCGTRFEGWSSSKGTSSTPGGIPWPEFDQSFYIYGGLDATETIESEITAREYAVYIGNSSAFYLPRFKALATKVSTFSINLSSLIFGFLYYFYRKMYLIGAILLVLYACTMVPNFMYIKETFPQYIDQFQLRGFMESLGYNIPSADTVNWTLANQYNRIHNIMRAVHFVAVAFMAFLANAMYLKKSTSDIKKVRSNYTIIPENMDTRAGGLSEYEARLAQKGGVNRTIVAVCITLYFVVSFIFSRYLMTLYL